jgi:hypothetical protein
MTQMETLFFALVLVLLLAQESLGKPEICRQHSPIASGQWELGDTFAYCALKKGQDTFKKFSNDFSKFFQLYNRSGISTVGLIGHNQNLLRLQATTSSWITKGVCKQSLKQWGLKQPCFKPQKPLFLHLSGPSSVGKTLFTELLADMFFKERRMDEKEQQRQLHHCGQSIHQLGHLERQSDLISLLDAMHEQLHYCPFSLFVFENLCLADKQLLRTLLSHLHDGHIPSSDEGEDSKPESIEMAMFVFTSDIGAYNASHSAQEARDAVSVSLRKEFDDAFSLRDRSDLSMFITSVLLDNVETFLPLRPHEIAQVAVLELTKIQQRIQTHSSFQDWKGSLKCNANCSANLADACFRNQYDCASRMVHGLKHFLADEIYSRMFELKFSDANFKNSDMNVVIVHNELQLVPVKMSEKPKRGASAANAPDL